MLPTAKNFSCISTIVFDVLKAYTLASRRGDPTFDAAPDREDPLVHAWAYWDWMPFGAVVYLWMEIWPDKIKEMLAWAVSDQHKRGAVIEDQTSTK